jgi:ADP-heptose:LPS heptosyltransferase
MNTEAMRYLDYWLGVPLCFILSGSNYIWQAIGFNGKAKEGRRPKILFIKLSEMGAIILAYPLLERVKNEYPSAEIFFLTFEKNKGILEQLSKIISPKNILAIREDSILSFAWDTLGVIKKIKKEGFDIVIDLEFFSRFTAILSYLSKAGKKVGFYAYDFGGLYRGNFLTHRIQYNPLLHIARVYLSMWQTVKEEKKYTPELDEIVAQECIALPRFISTATVRISLQEKLRVSGISKESRLFLLSPGEGVLHLREWPIENFVFLSKRILEVDPKNFIVLVGTKGAYSKAELVRKELDSARCINLTGRTDIQEVLELFNISEALIASDCGVAHLASLTPIKKFIIFGPETPRIFGPLGENIHIIYSNLACSPCLSVLNNRTSRCKDNKCLKIIRHEDVYDLISKHI